MSIVYPASLDTFVNPTAVNFTNSPAHHTQHSDANDAIVALETKIGTSSSTPTVNKVLVGSGTGTSIWSTTLAGLTLTTPTIADLTNSTHTHQNNAGGGTLAEAALSLSDNTTNDVSTSKHGFTPKAPNDTAKFLRGDGTWAAPAGGGVAIIGNPTGAPTISFNTTTYLDSGNSQNGNASNVGDTMTSARTVSKLVVRTSNAGNNTLNGNMVVTLMKNGSAQTVTVTQPASTNTAIQDTTHSFSVVAGDNISVKVDTTAAGSGNISVMQWAYEVA